jgi:parallel beta-helix repeat protein
MKTATYARVVAVACVIGVPLGAAAQQTKHRTCGDRHGHTLQHMIGELKPGDTLLVSGVCNENVVINELAGGITIDGQGTAVINGVDLNAPTVQVRGRSVTIRGFKITGGRHGVQYSRGATGAIDRNHITNAAFHGVGVLDNSFARIVDNTIEDNGQNGVCVCEHSSAEIGLRGDFAATGSPNTIRRNGGNGIVVNDGSYAEIQSNTVSENTGAGIIVGEGSSARIGFDSGPPGSFAGANMVHDNGNRGIVVSRSSTARIVANKIHNNTGSGVGVFRGSHADIAANDIDANTRDGVEVAQGSGANFGSDSGAALADQPNNTTVSNGRFGISCSIGGYIDGRRGTLDGTQGQQPIVPGIGCVDSTMP